ncbi:MAG TPA: endolytic transglycosylase MltG [Devosiaceae bacterium]|nr:endolytic transglycosylase MltG [Devosiaceae bacterium]
MADRKQVRVKRRRGFVEVVNALLTLIVIGLLVAAGLVFYGAHSFYVSGPAKADTTFVVQKGNNLGTVAERLEQQGLIDNRYVFDIAGFVLKKRSGLKTGEYQVAAGASMYDILKELTEGKPISLSITIPEGFTVAQVIQRLDGNDRLSGSVTETPPEGSLYPDTYDFDPGATRQSVLDRMQQAMKDKLAQVWDSRDPVIPVTTPDQLVTLASIVEKETPVPDERPRVAAVYYNRLVKHMRLQSDPTVVYGLTKGAGPSGRAPTRAELEQKTPYNTYQIDGLPPTPIANPGLEALKAAANPDKSNDVYFVAVSLNPKDGHLFAPTYSEQQKNVAKLRVLQRQAKADAQADADAAKEALEQQQAAQAGDPTAGGADTPPADAGPAAPQAAQPADAGTAAPAAVAPSPDGAAPDSATPQDNAPAQPAGDPNAPIPMPPDQRPTASDGAAPDTAKPAASRPAKPKPATADDAFGG